MATDDMVQTQPASDADALMAECRALLDRISQTSGIPIVQARDADATNLQAATAKTPDGQDVPALVIQMDRAELYAFALKAILKDAGLIASHEAFDLAVLKVKRDLLAIMVTTMEAKAAEAKTSKLTVAKGPALVLPAGAAANRAARRGQVTRVRD